MGKEGEYRHLVKMTLDRQKYFISLVKEGRDYYIRHYTWLLLMGLKETWEMKWTGKKNTDIIRQ